MQVRQTTIYLPFDPHQNDDCQQYELPFFEESSGTQSAFVLLDEVAGLRADDNLYAKYMSGALAAVPDL